MAALDFGNTLLSRLQGGVIESRTSRRVSGEHLKLVVAACAASLRDGAGLVPGPVLLVLDLSLESVIAYLGGLVSGRTVIPMDAKEWQQKGAELIELTRPAACWLPSRMKSAVTFGLDPEKIVRGAPTSVADAAVPSSASPQCTQGLVTGARVMVPTSGSTGKPSLVCVTDANLIASTLDIVESQGLSAQDKALLCLPLNYCFGASVLHSHLWVGGNVVVDDRLMFPEKVLDAIEAEGCTTFAGVPTSFLFLHLHSTVQTRKFSKLRLWLQAGGYLAAPIVHSFRSTHPQAIFAIMYGQTEATSRISSFKVDGDYPYGCVGYPMASLEVQIRTEDGALTGPCCEGNVWIRGASVCAGYFREPQREAEKFVDGWLSTGDIGYLLDDGRLCITGRSDGFIKMRGRRVSSLEIEDLVWKIFAIRSCACAVPDQASGEVIGLYLERSSAASRGITTTAIVAVEGRVDATWVERLRHALPQHWDLGPVVCGELPFTSSGKINRRACLSLLAKTGGER